ncbi:hypothetical protein C7C46_10490 [Streptomyces tateyamensis]|uniref:Uncharacterized protein n=1 Tax=Streptomyces tateyamensis TaxID=565073 RepID=A0A2V4NK86_9ACTN|nr:hypothetical protein [Streptomyces tateyamensis]PYC82764.1 hypothetical protein C7C46_10490 [Streptomyces tateyamensis]
MNQWINLHALWKIVVVGALTGAGLPAVFALGLRALSPPDRAGAGERAAAPRSGGPVGYAVAVLCFAVVLAAIGWGISVIVKHS